MADQQHFLEVLIEKHVKKNISELLKVYGEKGTTTFLRSDYNRTSEADDILAKVWEEVERINPKYVNELERKGNQEKVRAWIGEKTNEILKRRVEEHDKVRGAEDDIKKVEDFVEGRFPHLSKAEKEKIKEKIIREEYIDEKVFDKDIYQKVLKKREAKKKKEAEKKEWERLDKEAKKGGKHIRGHGEDYFTEGAGRKVRTGSDFHDQHWTEQRDAWVKFYEEEMENLRAAYNKGDMSPEEFRKNTRDLKKFVNRKMPERGKWSWRASRMGKHHYGTQLRRVVYILAAVLIGAIVSGITGSWMFFVGFLGVALYLVSPDPSNVEAEEGQKIGLSSILLLHPDTRSKQNTAGFLRSLGKVTAIAFFAFGFKGLGDVFNTLYIATAVIGYFMLKVEYQNSAEFIESLLRFFLGMILIPWIFNDIFGSLVLAGIAFAFFAVPPLPNEGNKNLGEVLSRGLSGATAYYEMAEKFIFGIIMLFVLIGSGALSFTGVSMLNPVSGWELTGSLQYTFIYFWLVCGVAGFFSPAKERPITGAIMLGAATIIYGIGPGSQQVGSGLLGDWWPTVNEVFTSVTEPMASLMGSLGNTFGQGFMLLTNPVGYASQLMNGSYTDSGTGKVGSYGVDISELTITDILPEQPFVVTAILENGGAETAGNVGIMLTAAGGDKFATTGSSRTGSDENLIDIGKLGFKLKDGDTGTCDHVSDNECWLCYGGDCDSDDPPEFNQLMVWQASFNSDGITCEDIVDTSMRKMYIPVTATVQYDYASDSRVEVEFISEAEWQRLAESGDLDSSFAFVNSEYSSAPVIFPIGTAGLKNPILETQEFHISMMLDSAFESGGEILNVEKVNLTYPSDWSLKSCTEGYSIKDNAVEWEPGTGGGKTLICYFKSISSNPDAMGGAPTKSYVVTAHTEYTFARSVTKDTKIEFGGFCCPDTTGCTENCESEDCLEGQYCIDNACVTSDHGSDTQAAAPVQQSIEDAPQGVQLSITEDQVNSGQGYQIEVTGDVNGKVVGKFRGAYCDEDFTECGDFFGWVTSDVVKGLKSESKVTFAVKYEPPTNMLLEYMVTVNGVESNTDTIEIIGQ